MPTITTTIARWGAEAGWAGSWSGPLWLLIPLVILATVAVWFFARRRKLPAPEGSDAVALLSIRYARGEIDTDEYRQRLDQLKGMR